MHEKSPTHEIADQICTKLSGRLKLHLMHEKIANSSCVMHQHVRSVAATENRRSGQVCTIHVLII
jgi:hypothetical protein